ncbi:MAG TPA: amidase domain-containing protein [Bacillota bacterium]|nr:amidase domain-containing protein [Bacillota bacterium]
MIFKRISILFFFLILIFSKSVLASEPDEKEISAFLEQFFQAKASLLINEEPDSIAKFYSNKIKTSRFALQMETRRSSYINAWANERNINLVNVSNKILRERIRITNDQVKVFLVNSLRMDYEYRNQNLGPQWFGIGTRHSLTLKKIDNEWRVIKEWYSDPMEEDPNNVPVQRQRFPVHFVKNKEIPYVPSLNQRKYNRSQAVAYADKYAGAAWGAGNDHRYNSKYADFNYQGGDCTNFASQVVGDSEGGGLKNTRGWRANRQGGTVAWVQTDAFKRFLISSGYGRVIATGTYRQVLLPSSRYPQGAMAQLQPGDMIGYIMRKNDIDHFSVVVGRDANGYVLVNSHSGDRYHVPWDIGWDKFTKFVLVHMND